MKEIAVIMIISSVFLSFNASRAEIDSELISGVQLVSLATDTQVGVNHLRLTAKARRAGNFEGIVEINKAIQKSIEHFFIALSLHNDIFWVNLTPDEAEKIIDPILADTDLGRIMLIADFRLKEDVIEIIDPLHSNIGKEYWRRLYEKIEELGLTQRMPLYTQVWIVPDKVDVYEKNNQVHIAKSTLKVKLNADYIYQNMTFKDKRQKELQDFVSELMRELVLPQLNKRINEDYAYADLRDVYNALILAQWYKEKFGSGYDSLLQLVNYRALGDIETTYALTYEDVYQSYLESIKKGRYYLIETKDFDSPFSPVVVTRQYFSGGVDLREIRITRLSSFAINESKSGLFYTCELFLPASAQRLLHYVKKGLTITKGFNLNENFSARMLERSFPEISTISYSRQKMRSLAEIDKTEKVFLSKL